MNPELEEIPDDPSTLQKQLDEMKKNFQTHQTKDIAFRKRALKSLLEGYNSMQEEIEAAVKKDLGNKKLMAKLTSHGNVNA